jgi:hypothetical protein
MTKTVITETPATIEPIEMVQEEVAYVAPLVTPRDQPPRKGKRTGDYVFEEALRKLQLNMQHQLRSNR